MTAIALSPHFTLAELTHSQTAARKNIDNTPTQEIINNLKDACSNLELVRSLLGQPLTITSGYRSPALNLAVGGSASSAHTQGHAIDFICPSVGTPLDICRKIKAAQIAVDQCIQEGTWVHISFAPTMRNQFLTAKFGPNGTSYKEGV